MSVVIVIQSPIVALKLPNKLESDSVHVLTTLAVLTLMINSTLRYRQQGWLHEVARLEDKVLKGRHRNIGDDHPNRISASSHWGVISGRSPVSIRSTYGGDGAEIEQESSGKRESRYAGVRISLLVTM